MHELFIRKHRQAAACKKWIGRDIFKSKRKKIQFTCGGLVFQLHFSQVQASMAVLVLTYLYFSILEAACAFVNVENCTSRIQLGVDKVKTERNRTSFEHTLSNTENDRKLPAIAQRPLIRLRINIVWICTDRMNFDTIFLTHTLRPPG